MAALRPRMDPDRFTIGIEEEYQLVDPVSGQLKGRAPEILADDWTGSAKEEYQQTMLEVASPACSSTDEVQDGLQVLRRLVSGLAERRGLAIAAAGLHPLGPLPAEQLSPESRYWRLAARGGVVARELHIFAMHVHIAVPDRGAAVRAMSGVVPYIPPLLAMAASSPFHLGRDTAFASFRTVLRSAFPRVGLPQPVSSSGEYDTLVDVLGGTPNGESPLSWDVRPSARYPTLEYRFFDAVPWLDLAGSLGACARALTAMFVDRSPPERSGLELQLLQENRWRAARFGLEARFFRLDSAGRQEWDARSALLSLIDRLGPVAERLGDGSQLRWLEAHVRAGNAAEAMRSTHREQSSFAGLVHWLIEQTLADDRGLDQRPC